jgi:hypothetical protein
MATSRRHQPATFKRPPAPNWGRGMHSVLAALYGEPAPLQADERAQIERECAAVPYRGQRQRDLPLGVPTGGRK